MQGWYVAAGVVIGVGCLWLAFDFIRHGNRSFALLFGLLAVERLMQTMGGPSTGLGVGDGVALTGFVANGSGVALALAVVVGRVVVGRGLYVLMRHRKVALERDSS